MVNAGVPRGFFFVFFKVQEQCVQLNGDSGRKRRWNIVDFKTNCIADVAAAFKSRLWFPGVIFCIRAKRNPGALNLLVQVQNCKYGAKSQTRTFSPLIESVDATTPPNSQWNCSQRQIFVYFCSMKKVSVHRCQRKLRTLINDLHPWSSHIHPSF